MINVTRVQESLGRAQQLNLEGLIKSLDEGLVTKGAKRPDRQEQLRQRRIKPRQIRQRQETLRQQISDPLAAQVRLERIIHGNELADIAYLARGIECARSVCRIAIRSERGLLGYGTGFMVAPGIMLTNHHVISNEELARFSIAQFRYERDSRGNDLEEVSFRLKANPSPILLQELDMALVAVDSRSIDGSASLDSYGWLKLSPQSGKAFIGEYLTIIQHPNGERKQVCVRENKLLQYAGNGPYLWYQTDTVGGSSGSPVFNNSWDVVALHHSGVPRTKKVGGRDVWLAKDGTPWNQSMGDEQVDWIANEGVRVSRIVNYLQTQHAGNAIAIQVLSADPLPPTERTLGGFGGGEGLQIQTTGCRTRILVPIEIGFNVGLTSAPTEPAPRAPAPDAVIPFIPTVIEAVVINQKNYSERNGYDPNFLEKGLKVPLPLVKGTKFGKPLPLTDKKSTELKYWNYSVVMNKDRGLAFFSAANIHSGKFRGKRADGDTWYIDKRIIEEAQIGKEFYKEQKTFEAKLDRTKNPFDQGHLSRRSDLQWGDDDETAKRNGDDTFHYTNCSPQHWQFNQNNKASGLWYSLEDTAISKNPGGRITVINGPVFDAPLSTLGADSYPRLNLKGKRVPDGEFGGFKIPKQFFKVIAYPAGNNELKALAFVVTQEDLLANVDRYYTQQEAAKLAPLTDEEVRLYQVTIRELEALTGLDFGTLSDHDAAGVKESDMLGQGLPLESLDQVIF